MRPTKHFIFLSIDGLSDPLGQSQILPYLYKLSEQGFLISIVSVEKRKNFSINFNLIQQQLIAQNIKWEYSFYKSTIPIISQFYNYYLLNKNAKKTVNANYANTILHCRSYIPALIGLNFKKKYACKFIFDMRGFWIEERVEGKIWSNKNIIHRLLISFFKKKEIEFFKYADSIVSLTQKAKNIIIKEFHVNDVEKITTIPCCVDLALFNQNTIYTISKHSKTLLELKKEFFILCYIGSLGTWYKTAQMLEFFNELSKTISSKFVIITKDDSDELYSNATSLSINPSDLILIQAERNEIPNLLNCCSASVFFIEPSYSKQASSPTKLGEVLAMQLPVVCNSDIGDVDEIISAGKCGVVITNFTNESYKNAAQKLVSNFEFLKQNSRACAVDYFDLNKGAESYSKIYKKFL